jgi:hypothetical protein
MPDISLLEPVVLNGLVSKFVAPQTLALLPNTPTAPSVAPDYAIWDVLKGGRQVAGLNVPNAEAQILDQLGRSQERATFAYTRVKKVFNPTTLHWLRAPGTLSNTQNAEMEVMRELTDMNSQIDFLQEQSLWGAYRGSWTGTVFGGSSFTINYGFPASHLVSAANAWTTATIQSIVDDVFTWKRIIRTHGRVEANKAYGSSTLLRKIIDRFAFGNALVVNSGGGQTAVTGAGTMLSDRAKDAYFAGEGLPGFMGLDWYGIDEVYIDGNGNTQYFVGDGTSSNQELFIGNYDDGRPVSMMYGASADDDAPEGHYGKFTKTWKEPDPSARQVLMELNFLPIVQRPEQLIYCSNVG